MTRLHTAFDALIADRPPRGADAVLAAARSESAPHGRRGRPLLLAAAAVLVAVALAAALLANRDHRQRVTAGPPTSATTTTDAATTTVADGVVVPEGVALASPRGVEVVVADGPIAVSDEPATIAFAGRAPDDSGADQWVVAYQGRDLSMAYTAVPDGPVRVVRGGETQEIDPGEGAHAMRLLDLRVEGAAVRLLVAEDVGDITPDALRERLVVIDLATGRRQIVADRLSWESATRSARLLPEGSVVALLSAEAHDLVVRWQPGGAEPVWSHEVAIDRAVSFVADDERGTALAIGRDPDGTVTFDTQAIDLATGGVLASTTIRPTIDGRPPREGLTCTDQLGGGRALCSSPTDGVVVLDADGTGHRVQGSRPDTVATTARR